MSEMILDELPNNEEAEKAVLGAIILDNHLLSQAVGRLEPDDFYSRSYRQIFLAMIELDAENVEINPITIDNRTRYKQPQLGVSQISDLTYGLPHSTNLIHYLTILKEKSALRKIVRLANSLNERAMSNESVLDLFLHADHSLVEIRRRLGPIGDSFRPLSEVAADAADEYQRLREGESSAILTGYKSLDRATRGGIQPGDVWVIASLTGKGKSSWALGAAKMQAQTGIAVAIVSREMSNLENFMRLHSAASGVPVWQIRKGMNTKVHQRLEHWQSFVASLPIWINSSTSNVCRIRAQVKELVQTFGVKSLIVDYLQLMGVSSEARNATRAQEIAGVSRVLKEIAMENQIGVIALAQFNRLAANEAKPSLHHLAESSGIEKDASVVLILDMPDQKELEIERDCTMRIAKHRNGPLLSLSYRYRCDTLTFEEIDGAEVQKDYEPKL